MLELYQFEECPYSTQVRLKMSEWEIDSVLRNVSKLKSKRRRLKKVSGQTGVPTLIDSWRNVTIAMKKRSSRISANTIDRRPFTEEGRRLSPCQVKLICPAESTAGPVFRLK